MRLWLWALGVASFTGSAALGMSCAAGDTGTNANGNGGNSGDPGGAGAQGQGGSTFSGGGNGEGGSGIPECAKFTAAAKQAPAAIMFVLDKTASMNVKIGPKSKWAYAVTAVVDAIDADAFDNISLGLVAFPLNQKVPGPQCLFGGIIPVTCGVPALPQVPLADSGIMKSSDPTGVRHQMYNVLAQLAPPNNMDDGSPVYDALNGAYDSLRSYDNVDKRIAVLLSDGGFSCTSLSSPTRPGYNDPNNCPDWEQPPVMNDLITAARTDASKPVNTFIVGVPGSNSNGEDQGPYATPPYNMRLALSTYAVSGSPDTVDPACDKTAVFTQGGTEPSIPCHIDLSSGTFDSDVLANAITQIRGKALGCIYDLPEPPVGQTIDPAQVNVRVTLNGSEDTIPKRSNPNDDCATDGCWDYNVQQQVQLLGKTCADVTTATDAKVEIYVGCATIVK
jgi:hypothetical protein